MPRIKQFALKIVLLAIITLCVPGVTGADKTKAFNQFIGFGDSTLDTGYFRYHTTGIPLVDQLLSACIAQGTAGGFAGNGIMNSTLLAQKFNLNAAPIDGGGANYANGGSYTAINAAPYPTSVSAIVQIENYLALVHGVANPNALYVISSGNNDISFPHPLPPNFFNNSATELALETARLQAAGARTIMVPNSYRCAVLAGLGGDIAPKNAAEYTLTVSYYSARWDAMRAANVNFIPADLDSVFKYVVHNPTLFGFTASSVLATRSPHYNYPPPFNSALFSILTPAQQQEFLFIDGKHLTTAGQTIQADYEYSLLIAPSEISLLTENAIQNGLARTSAIQRQIDFSGLDRGPKGINLWVSAGARALELENAEGFTDSSGIPFGGTVGVDYRTQSGIILGAAFTALGQTQDFSTGGHFDQTDEAPSVYAAYKAGPVWGNIVATYNVFQDNITRTVPLGIFTDVNNADTDGYSLALALRAGSDFKIRKITTGPVAGIVMQRAHLDHFTETGKSGVTALSFDGQTRDSLVSQLGWRVLVDAGKWQPFAEVEWNHEWADKNDTVTASLTSVAAPSYTMDAFPIASDWGNVTLGSSYRINAQWTMRGSVSAVFLNPEVMSFDGELGMNISF